MKNFEIKLNKFALYAIYAIFAMTCINSCNSCTNMMSVSENTDKIEELDSAVIIMNQNMISKEDLNAMLRISTLQMEIEGLKASKRILYDENLIVRTNVRPDDRMVEYDDMISQKEKELKELLGEQ